MKSVLTLEHISKSFGGIKALRDVNLVIHEGERIAIIGPNGAGKTTLFNIINGVYRPDTGRILYGDTDITNMPTYRRAQIGIARTFQVPRPFPDLSVRDNVMVSALFSGKKLGLEEALKIVDRVLDMTGLKRKSKEPASSLTSPEKKLLELARALAAQPKVLLLDEIVAGMPPTEVDNLMLLVRRVAEAESIAVVALIEHVMRAVRYADRAVFLYQGRILVEGTPQDVLSNELVRETYLGGVTYE